MEKPQSVSAVGPAFVLRVSQGVNDADFPWERVDRSESPAPSVHPGPRFFGALDRPWSWRTRPSGWFTP
jgi:hypothetical protein